MNIIMFFREYKKHLFLIITGLAIVLFLSYHFYQYQKNSDEEELSNSVAVEIIQNESENNIEEVSEVFEEEEIIDTNEYYKIDIKGAVVNPGVYDCVVGSVVIDAINLAGGLSTNANTTYINLSKRISDEMVIIVYTQEEVDNIIYPKDANDVDISEEVLSGSTIIESENSETVTDSKISINTATIEELQTLPSIGEVKAQNIIDYRNTNGEFKSLEEIKNVSGIGDSIYEQIKDYITL